MRDIFGHDTSFDNLLDYPANNKINQPIEIIGELRGTPYPILQF
jgi:hypothetical protein